MCALLSETFTRKQRFLRILELEFFSSLFWTVADEMIKRIRARGTCRLSPGRKMLESLSHRVAIFHPFPINATDCDYQIVTFDLVD